VAFDQEQNITSGMGNLVPAETQLLKAFEA
jgi:hypothetical protein